MGKVMNKNMLIGFVSVLLLLPLLVMLLIGVFGFGYIIAQNQMLSSLFLGFISLILFIVVKEQS